MLPSAFMEALHGKDVLTSHPNNSIQQNPVRENSGTFINDLHFQSNQPLFAHLDGLPGVAWVPGGNQVALKPTKPHGGDSDQARIRKRVRAFFFPSTCTIL